MAKERATNGNGWVKVAGFAVTVGLVLATVLLAWGDQKKETAVLTSEVKGFIESDDKRTEKLDHEGTLKCKKNAMDIVEIKKDVEFTADAVKDIRDEQKTMRAEQKSDFNRLLKAVESNR